MIDGPRILKAKCCVVGGGPAGIVLAYLLARSGTHVVVLEKHGDFLRDFRGDTVHPSTMTVLDELGLLEDFLKMPHAELQTIGVKIGADSLTLGDFSHIPAKTKFLAIMPQWDFLQFLSERARRFPGFTLLMRTNATSAIEEEGRVVGVRAEGPEGPLEIRADLIVAADGRHSTMRGAMGAQPRDLGAPMDVLWFRISRLTSDPASALGYVGAGGLLVTIDRVECGYVIPKGTFETIKSRGLDELRVRVAAMAPFLSERVRDIREWEDVKLLEVRVDRLERWYRPGLLCIGDAAHAMSPIGGVGINLAIQDAVAAANLLQPALARGAVDDAVLAGVQVRREWPAKMTQNVQVVIQNRVVAGILRSQTAPKRAPLLLRLIAALPLLRRLPALAVGIGFRPEHVEIPAAP
jgi:2-polyprenyl-6-methoxyphenol hydroxylase-like FAD-dependent oxidoreductase